MAQPVVSVSDYFEAFETLKTVVSQRAEQLNEKLVIGHSCHTVEAQNESFKFKPELVYTCHVSLYTFNSKGRKKKIVVNI